MRREQPSDASDTGSKQSADARLIPSISLPKGGGAISGMGEKFGANPVTGTGSMTVPIAISPTRFAPALSLSYDSGAGNSPFGLGWSLSTSAISRRTDKGLPRYRDADESDVFLLSDAEDLVPMLVQVGGVWVREELPPALFGGATYTVRRYRPRIEGLFARIERWTAADGTSFWKTISKDNVANLFGVDANGRVADSADPTHIFKWLLQRSHDDKGNVCVYEYKPEDRDNVADALHEVNRSVGAQRYLKRIRYGNAVPYYPDALDSVSLQLPDRWYFQVVFDYGEHDLAQPHPEEDISWPARADPVSNYRSGFELRSHRLCRRVLMFHDFPELGDTPCLVRSTDFTHDATPVASFLRAVQQTAYRRASNSPAYFSRSMPPVEFTYSEARIDDTVQVVAADSLENLPYGEDGNHYQWLDLDSEGSPGILSEQGEGWFYTRNVSNLPQAAQGGVRAAFEPVELVASKPSMSVAGTRHQFMDLGGEGQQCLVQFDRPMAGYQARNDLLEWEPFTPFESGLNIDFADPNLRMIDLDGDGFADVLVSEDEVFSWHTSRGRQGFAAAETVRRPVDEDEGPALVFADSTQSVFLADFTGDGLTDLVRIRNGEVCYWPNLGYGQFGRKIAMTNSPLFDLPDQFDQKRIRLADVDGSGTTDIIYLGAREVAIYSNQSGNSWAAKRALTQFPAPDNLASVAAVDLLGNGTACLVCSSPAPGEIGRQMRYVDLMGGQKPHLLVGTRNNLGAETRVHYVASTQFYLQDRRAGTPWITRLPFPVHVVDRVEVYDALSRTRFASRYAYHHGFYDGVEREFRGFGMVEQWDSEAFAAFAEDPAVNLDDAHTLPPVLTRSWFHTGAYLQGARVSLLFKDEYYREPNLDQSGLDAMLLPDTVLPLGLGAEEAREACRSLKGMMLRQEVYALDDTPRASQPYSVSEQNFTIERVQPQGDQRHAVFFMHAREKIDYHYERALYDINGVQRCDPRVSHAMTLAVDDYGNRLRAVAIGYGRRFNPADPLLTADDITRQKRINVVMSEGSFTNAVLDLHAYRTPLAAEARSYELLKVTPQANLAATTNLFRFDEMQALVDSASDGAHDIPHEDIDGQGASGAGPYRRLMEESRSVYRRDDLAGALPPGVVEPLALPFESYQLAFTPGLLAVMSARISVADATALLKSDEGRYQDLDGDGRLWIPSGRVFLSPDVVNPDAAFAREHRYLPQAAQDPFGNVSRVAYDKHELFVARTEDALGNTVLAEFDYRVLQPSLVTDPNGNRSAVAFDVFGMLVATAVMGKVNEPDGMAKGDLLQGFSAELSDAEIDAFLNDPRGQAGTLLGQATSRVVYDIDRFRKSGEPAFGASVVRETHVADLAPTQSSKLQVSISYSDGFARIIQSKVPAAPGPVEAGGPSVDPRWIGSGWTIFNNKGKPVRQYEPFFSATHRFEFAVKRGVSPTLFFDPLGRVTATLHPDHTYDKVRFDPWWQQTWDANDTVTLNPANDPDVAPWFSKLPPSEYLPTWFELRTDPANAALAAQRWPDVDQRAAEADAANKTSAHAGTPGVAHLDSSGRTFLTVADNAAEGKFATRLKLDVEGNEREVIDALDRVVMKYDCDMLGTRILQQSMEAGARWTLNDVAGKPIRSWDSRGKETRTEYDSLHRPLKMFVLDALVAKTEYGEGIPNAAQLNLREKSTRHFDTAGVVTNEAFDFKGNLLRSSRQLARDFKSAIDWSSSPALEPRTFTSSTTFNATNRRATITAPDGSVYHPSYNVANQLESLSVNLRGAQVRTPFVNRVEYDAKGQRERIEYGNGASTAYTHDPLTFRLTQLQTVRASDHERLQDLRYAYDPVGNVTRILDEAQQTTYFSNQVVSAQNDYRYDPIYRLQHAEGREHVGQLSRPETTWNDAFRVNLPQPGVGEAMRHYAEDYQYDAVGNFLELNHHAVNGNWNCAYAYDEPSLLEATRRNNRLSRTITGMQTPGSYIYDAHGNMTSAPHLSSMSWDFMDRLASTSRQVVNDGTPETTYYVYDGAGQRVRKITERQSGMRKNERIYLGGFEVYLEYDGGGEAATLERETLHVTDDEQRIALVETRLPVDGNAAEQLIRYQFGNHLGSASLELDVDAKVISYEEYFPYGSTSYQAVRAGMEASPKRYRFTNMERDDETGFSYHSARYYAPWLGRWTSPDPASIEGGIQLYSYSAENPVLFTDTSGLKPDKKFVPPKRPPLKKTPTKAPAKTAKPVDATKGKKDTKAKDDKKGKDPKSEKDTKSVTPPAAVVTPAAPATAPSVPPAAKSKANVAFRAARTNLSTAELDNIDTAIAKVSAENPKLADAFYTFYEDHKLTDKLASSNPKLGDTDSAWTSGGFYTDIDKDVMNLIAVKKGPSDNLVALLGGVLIHEYSHGDYAIAGLTAVGPTEGKAYAIESFFAARMGDKTRSITAMNLAPKYGDQEAFDSADYVLNKLHEVVLGGTSKDPAMAGITKEQAQDLEVEFIAKNKSNFGTKLDPLVKSLLKNASSAYAKRSYNSLP